ncbi:MAG TPA: ABC transporter permease, partial [Saliniramus sp.]|nr:ABC transporter permease [Saliniramus sp.]
MGFRTIQITFGAIVVVFLLAPIAAILPLAFTDSIFLSYPMSGFSLRWFDELSTSDAWRRSIVNSLVIGSSAAILSTVIGTMAALGLRSRALPFTGLLRTMFVLPMVVPSVVLVVGIHIMYARMGLASSYLGEINA